MLLSTGRKLLILIVLATSLLGCKSRELREYDRRNVTSVSVPAAELPKGYLKWLHVHPSVLHQSADTGIYELQSGETYEINWPHLDIYNPDGSSRFYGERSDENVRLLDAMPESIPTSAAQMPLRPTLIEAIAMFPEIPAEAAKSSGGLSTVFVVFHPDRPAGFLQDQAVQRLKKRVEGTHVRIIEVRLKTGV